MGPLLRDAAPVGDVLVRAGIAGDFGYQLDRSRMNRFVAGGCISTGGAPPGGGARPLRREQVSQIFGTESGGGVAFVEKRRGKLAFLLVKLDDAFFDRA